jgi:hypothetical protein
MLAEQLTSERPDRVEANGRTVDEWSVLPGRDNHFLDCITGCAVLAHAAGARFANRRPVVKRPAQQKEETKCLERPKRAVPQAQKREVVF